MSCKLLQLRLPGFHRRNFTQRFSKNKNPAALQCLVNFFNRKKEMNDTNTVANFIRTFGTTTGPLEIHKHENKTRQRIAEAVMYQLKTNYLFKLICDGWLCSGGKIVSGILFSKNSATKGLC